MKCFCVGRRVKTDALIVEAHGDVESLQIHPAPDLSNSTRVFISRCSPVTAATKRLSPSKAQRPFQEHPRQEAQQPLHTAPGASALGLFVCPCPLTESRHLAHSHDGFCLYVSSPGHDSWLTARAHHISNESKTLQNCCDK